MSPAVDTAANCAAGFATVAAIQRFAVSELVIVSMVVKVFDATITSVVAGFKPLSVSWICAPSTFETKWQRGPSAKGCSAR